VTTPPEGSRASDYDYDLPPERIARYPANRRDESRLLVLPEAGNFQHATFGKLVELIEPGDLLVVNESRVLPARLLGHKPTGAPSEILLLRPSDAQADPYLWEALVRPGGKLKPGRTVVVADDLTVEILDSIPGGGRIVRLVTADTVEEALERHGHMPLPPYLGREDEPLDRERYQTVYATDPGSVAAPTAGLHFTRDILDRLDAKGVRRATVTLHVGIGTFRPVEVDDLAHHEMHEESYRVPSATAELVNATRAEGGRVWAVGTTTLRTLESSVDDAGQVLSGARSTDLFVRPPYDFAVVDCLLTNFHLPRSSLLMLVAAFAGYHRAMAAYDEAIRGHYRFYSYGDAMAVVGGA
jgi:S-adenosylmethionine:tRNA ribosyltransferase-isomerase